MEIVLFENILFVVFKSMETVGNCWKLLEADSSMPQSILMKLASMLVVMLGHVMICESPADRTHYKSLDPDVLY